MNAFFTGHWNFVRNNVVMLKLYLLCIYDNFFTVINRFL